MTVCVSLYKLADPDRFIETKKPKQGTHCMGGRVAFLAGGTPGMAKKEEGNDSSGDDAGALLLSDVEDSSSQSSSGRVKRLKLNCSLCCFDVWC